MWKAPVMITIATETVVELRRRGADGAPGVGAGLDHGMFMSHLRFRFAPGRAAPATATERQRFLHPLNAG
jgi:hypothetical protein